MKKHEEYITKILTKEEDAVNWEHLKKLHKEQLEYMQQERIIHLLVTLFIGLFGLLSIFFSSISPSIPGVLLDILFIALFIPYIFHYYFLENTIQRWYKISNEIESKISILEIPKEMLR